MTSSLAPIPFYALTHAKLKSIFAAQNLPERGAHLLFNWHYKKNQRQALTHQDLSQATQKFIASQFDFSLAQIRHVSVSSDQSAKFLIEFSDQRRVEAVLIPFLGKYTVCLSSQVGCAMNCSFCATGKQGLSRNLNTEEIISQLLLVKEWLTTHRPGNDRILNLVFMGQGEPLHNFSNVRDAIAIFLSVYGLSFSPAKITVSTSGFLPGLKRWPLEMPPVNIALSLHSLSCSKRAQLIPLENRFPLQEILPFVTACIPKRKKSFVTYEYLLLKDFNDSPEEAHELGQWLVSQQAFINLIPFNPIPNSNFAKPSLERIQEFFEVLRSYHVPVTLRRTKGDEVMAACGQLHAEQV